MLSSRAGPLVPPMQLLIHNDNPFAHAPPSITRPGSPARAPELVNIRLHAGRAAEEGTVVGCTLVTLKHHQRVVWIQTVAKQHHDFLRTACGGTIGRVLSASASQLVLAYTQIVRPAHMCLRLRLAAGDDDDASAAAADTAFLACTTRGRLGAKQVRRAWQRHWEHFACGWARKQPPPTTLSFAAYRHVAIALQTSVLLPRAIASATMHASQIVRKKGETRGGGQPRGTSRTWGVAAEEQMVSYGRD